MISIASRPRVTAWNFDPLPHPVQFEHGGHVCAGPVEVPCGVRAHARLKVGELARGPLRALSGRGQIDA